MKPRFLILACFVLAFAGFASAQTETNPCTQAARKTITFPPPQQSIVDELNDAVNRVTDVSNNVAADLNNALNFLQLGDLQATQTALFSAQGDLAPILSQTFGAKLSDPITKEGK